MYKLKYFVLPLVLGIFIASCEKDDNTVIDPVLNIPVLDSAKMNPTSFDTSHININFQAYVTSVDPVDYVAARIVDPLGHTWTTVNLTPSGTSFTGNLDMVLSCWLVGEYNVEFIAYTSAGLTSNSIVSPFNVTNTNSVRPTINIIYAPDSIQRPPPNVLASAFLKVHVIDPDGICDIASAYFNAFNPSGVPNPSNPFAMYDDGDVTPPHCDTVAGDGKYSLLIVIDNNASLGVFTFKFNARDRSGLVSDTLYKFITVYP